MLAQLCEYTKKITELYTSNQWTLWYIKYIPIELFKKKKVHQVCLTPTPDSCKMLSGLKSAFTCITLLTSKPPPFPLPTPHCSCGNPTGLQRHEGWINKAKTFTWPLRPDGQQNHRGQSGYGSQVSESECVGEQSSQCSWCLPMLTKTVTKTSSVHLQCRLANLYLKIKSDLMDPTRSPQ